MTITPQAYNPTPNYTANDNLFSNLYISYNDGTIGASATFQPYENWASVNGISIGGSFSGDGYSFYIGFSWSFPVVLDLDGDGVELTSVLDSTAWFDIKGDGTLHQTGWVGADDGLLAFDENGDGLITTGREIAFADRTAANDTDLEALRAEFDSNNDGKLDANDTEFSKFYIWQDKDSDGESDTGELLTLTQAGITSINLVSTGIGSYMIDGNKVNAFTSYTRADGSVGIGGDVSLAYDNAGYTTTVQNGYMTVKQTGSDATYAMATSSSSLIINLVDNNLTGAFGNDGNDTLDANGKTTTVILEGGKGSDTLKGGSGDDWLDGGAGDDTISGGKGNDTIVFDNDDNLTILKGGEGLDTLIYRGTTKDLNINMGVLEVEAAYLGDGNDTILDYNVTSVIRQIPYTVCGANGCYTIMIDTPVDIFENAGEDTIVFEEGININDLQIKKVNNDTVIETIFGDKILIKNFNKYETIENLTFADGSTYKLQGLIIGTQGNDNLVGDSNANMLLGKAGDDIMNGQAGSDNMIGGTGDDIYYIDNTGDILTENSNEGIDTVNSSISYTLGANIENLTLSGSSAINGTGNNLDNVIIANSGSNILNGGEGSDTINGGLGADKLVGGLGNDTFVFNSQFIVDKFSTLGFMNNWYNNLYFMKVSSISSNGNIDTIMDFSTADDIIQLDDTVFAKLTNIGTLNSDNFRSSTNGAAADSNEYILYNISNGNLSYDADGNGSGAAIVFATLSNKPVDLTYNDFVVI
jgi:Ca2+-binding RTX toxin-like protein